MGSFLTMALFFTILITPRASVTVTTIGRPSGMAATARLQETRAKPVVNHQDHVDVALCQRCVACSHLTPMVNMSRILFPCSHPTSMMTPENTEVRVRQAPAGRNGPRKGVKGPNL